MRDRQAQKMAGGRKLTEGMRTTSTNVRTAIRVEIETEEQAKPAERLKERRKVGKHGMEDDDARARTKDAENEPQSRTKKRDGVRGKKHIE